MEVGDIVYIVPAIYPIKQPYEAPVWYSGKGHFSAGDFTFVRAAGDAHIGTHSRAKAYATQYDYETRQKKRDAWNELRCIVTMHELPPLRLTAEEIESIVKLLKGNSSGDISS
jgi:hypothetical protein